MIPDKVSIEEEKSVLNYEEMKKRAAIFSALLTEWEVKHSVEISMYEESLACYIEISGVNADNIKRDETITVIFHEGGKVGFVNGKVE